MENNNDNNLFTSMFGVESEEKNEPLEQPVQQPVSQPVQQPIPNPIPVQPEPTTIQPSNQIQEEIIVLDSNKVVEEPITKIEQQPTNAIEMNLNYQPVKPVHQKDDEDLESENFKPENYKILCIALGITLAVVLLAFPLYTGLNKYLSTPKEENKEIIEETKNQENELSEQQPQTPTTPPINFDMNLSFDKGYTNNANEYKQKTPYKPENYEGVIKCETINKIINSEGQFQSVVYLYYKDLMVKKYIVIDNIKLNNSRSYNEFISYYQSLQSLTSSNEHLFTELLVSNSTYNINFKMLIDLAYNQAIRVPEEKIYYDVSLSYNIPVKNAMSKYLTDPSFAGNLQCSTLVTSDASI